MNGQIFRRRNPTIGAGNGGIFLVTNPYLAPLRKPPCGCIIRGVAEQEYEVRRRRWPFRRPLARPWELIRLADGKPVGFYATALEAMLAAPKAGQ